MDRLYRAEIEEEDRELDRERALDVGPYYQTPKAEIPQPPPPVAVAQKPSRALLYAAVGGAVVLLSVIAYLLISRPSSAPVVDQEAQKRMLQELVNTQVAQALKEKEDQLRKELEAEKARTADLRQQLEKQKQGAGGARPGATEEQQRLQKELAAREAEQKRKEEELASVRQQQQAELVRVSGPPIQPTVAAAPPPVAVTATYPVATPTAMAAATPTTAPIPAMAVRAVATPARNVPVEPGPESSVHEGDLVDAAEVDVPPQTLVETKVELPLALARTPLSGYVILDVLVNEKGGVDDVKVVHAFAPPAPAVDRACIEAVKKNRYKPAMKGGKAVKTWMMVRMVFTPATR
jgi:TonB family protein